MTIAETASESPWAAFAPTLLEIPQDRWEEFLKTAPADTLISLGGGIEDIYQKGFGIFWVDLQAIDQPYDEDDYAGHQEVAPSQILSYASASARRGREQMTIKVLRLGGKS